VTSGGGKYGEGVLYCLDTVYLVTGAFPANPPACKNNGTDQYVQHLEFQGNGQSWVYTNSIAQVATHMAGLQPGQSVASMQTTNDGITVRVKVPNAQIVQFFYREEELNGELQAGIASEANLPETNAFDPNRNAAYQWQEDVTYDNKDIVTVGDQYWISTRGSNKGHKPEAPTFFWSKLDSKGCTDAVHSCYPLTTDSRHPNWIPDAEPANPIYKAQDTQLECDGLTIFDSPSFNPSAHGETWWFTGMDYIIVGGKVIGTVTWEIQKPPNKPLVYTFVGFGNPPAPQVLTSMRNVLKKYGFTQVF
jgi:hypothetical protein